MSIEDNVRCRKAAEEAFALVSDSLREELGGEPELLGKAWQQVCDAIAAVVQKPEEPAKPIASKAMSDAEAKRFENSTMQFGKHKGELVKDVPLSYLSWIDEDTFRADLRRYLLRDEVWREQEETCG